MNRFRILLPLAAIVFGLALLAGCGGDSGDDPQQVLDDTFNADQQAHSGVLDLTIDVTAEGGTGGNATINLNGPFQGSGDPTQLPQFNLTAKATATGAGQNLSFDGGLALTSDNAYVTYQGQAYEVGQDTFNQLQGLLQKMSAVQSAQGGTTSTTSTTSTATSITDQIKQSCETAAEQAGGDPTACDNVDYSGWTTNLSNEGTTDIDGTSTIHIHGDLDVAKIVQGFIQISQAAAPSGSAVPVPSEDQINQVTSAISAASFDIYTGESDHIVRGIDTNITVNPSAIPGASVLGISSVTLHVSARLSQVNQPQTIEGPTNAKPLSDLFGQFPSLGGLGGVPSIPGVQ